MRDEWREKIMRLLDHEFIRRMRNWARAGTEASASISSVYDDVLCGSDGYSSRIPTLFGEAEDTDRALAKLPVRYSAAVRVFWQWEGISLREMGRKLRADRHYVTERVRVGHQLLDVELKLQAMHYAQLREERRVFEGGMNGA
jgi:hypothetical protein